MPSPTIATTCPAACSADLLGLLVRQHFGEDVVDGNVGGDRLRGRGVVAGEHPHLQAECLQLGDRAGGIGLDGIGHDDQAGRFRIDGSEHRGLAGGGRLAGLRSQRRDVDARLGEECGVADQDAAALDRGVDAPAGDGGEALDGGQRQAAVAGRGDDRGAQRVFAAGLGGRDDREQGRRVPLAGRADPGHGGPALGDRAGLVQDDRSQPAGLFERVAVADQDAELGGLAGAHHDRGRGGQAERAGAGDDEHRDGGADRHGPVVAGRAGQGPDSERDDGGDEDAGHEPRRDGVGQALHRRLGALRVLDEPDDLRECGVLAHGRRAEQERAGAVDGRANDLVPGRLADRGALAGEHALVDRRYAVDDDPVDRDLLPGPDPDHVCDEDLPDRDVLLTAVADHPGRLRGQSDEFGDGGGGALLGAQFHPAAHQDQGDDHQGGLEVQVQRQPGSFGDAGPQDDEGAVAPGHGGAESDQGVHVGRAVPGGRPRGGVEATAGPELQDGCDDEDGRHQPVHGVQVQRQVHQRHQPETGRQGDLPFALEVTQLRVMRSVGRGRRVLVVPRRRPGAGRAAIPADSLGRRHCPAARGPGRRRPPRRR
jgi:hypothetical protein